MWKWKERSKGEMGKDLLRHETKNERKRFVKDLFLGLMNLCPDRYNCDSFFPYTYRVPFFSDAIKQPSLSVAPKAVKLQRGGIEYATALLEAVLGGLDSLVERMDSDQGPTGLDKQVTQQQGGWLGFGFLFSCYIPQTATSCIPYFFGEFSLKNLTNIDLPKTTKKQKKNEKLKLESTPPAILLLQKHTPSILSPPPSSTLSRLPS